MEFIKAEKCADHSDKARSSNARPRAIKAHGMGHKPKLALGYGKIRRHKISRKFDRAEAGKFR